MNHNDKVYKKFLFQFSTERPRWFRSQFSIHNLRLYEIIKSSSFSTEALTQRLGVPIHTPTVSSSADEADILISDNNIYVYEKDKENPAGFFPINGQGTIGHTNLKSTAVKFNNEIYIATGIRFVRLRRVVNKYTDTVVGAERSQSIWVMDYMDEVRYQPDEKEIPLYGFNILADKPEVVTIDPNQITERELRLTTEKKDLDNRWTNKS